MTIRLLISTILFSVSGLSYAGGLGAGTPINTPTGQKNIEDVHVRDEVIVCNSNGECVTSKVTKLVQQSAKIARKITLSSGESILAALGQKFMIDGNWVMASKIHVGDKISNFEVVETAWVREETTLYTFIVGTYYNYYAKACLARNPDGTSCEFAVSFGCPSQSPVQTPPRSVNQEGPRLSEPRPFISGNPNGSTNSSNSQHRA